ncbi:MAG: GNAT family N-acetyltransferase [Firmicutes bacterium]|nr:GNAT family N-acetyltransferase [Bacillota bacterium]
MRYVRATAEDQARIQEFLSQFVDDYLAEHIATYLSLETGGIYLALDDNGQLAAMAVVDMVKTHEAYLSGMRVRPELQGTSVGTDFAAFQVQEAKRLGAQVIRALVGRGNESAQQILQEKFGFHVVDEWVVGSMQGFEAPTYADGVAGPAWAVDRDRLEAFFRQYDEELWSGHNHWLPRALSFDDVWHGVEQGALAVAPQETQKALDTVALFEIYDGAMHLNYLRSMGQHLKSLIQYLWVEARAWGVKTLHFGLPRHAADKFVEMAGLPLTREWHGLVLEKHVGLTSTSVV